MTIVGNNKKGGTRIEPIGLIWEEKVMVLPKEIIRLRKLLDKIRSLAYRLETDEIVELINKELGD